MNTHADHEPGRILIVDDERNMRITLADILEDEGYEVDVAASGEEAVEKCLRQRYSIILLDVRMPGIDGVETFRQIRQHQKKVRIVLMSAYSVDDLKDAALKEGAIALLAKPLDVEQVVKLIGEVRDTSILVVENDEPTAQALYNELKQHGYWVTLSNSPDAALELAEQIRFDLIFIDAEQPAMNGLELYLAIRKLTPNAVAIMISGKDEGLEAIAQEAVRQTAYAVVQKPLDLEHVLGMLKRITSQRVSNHLRKPPS